MKKNNVTDIELWAKIYNDSFVNEACTDEDDTELTESPAFDSPSDATLRRRQEMMAAVAAKNKSDFDKIQQDEFARKNQRTIKQIWVKDLIIQYNDEQKSKATLEITYSDGTVDNVDFSIGTTGGEGRYIDRDQLYVACKRQLAISARKAGVTVSDTDVRLSMIRVSYPQPGIKWVYGPAKISDRLWNLHMQATTIGTDPAIENALEDNRITELN